MNNIKILSVFVVLTTFFTSCSNNPLDVDTSDIKVDIQYVNVDKSLFSSNMDTLKKNFNNLNKKLGSFLLYELSWSIQDRITDTSYQKVYDFYNSKFIKHLEKEKAKLFSELPDHQKKIDAAFEYLNYHFGDSIVPNTIFYINNRFGGVTCSDSAIAVGLESYIKPKDTLIRSFFKSQLYGWQKERMDIKYLERDVLLNWIQLKLFNAINGKFAEHLIQAGKVFYILNACFPDASEKYILRYSKQQLQWADKNESMIWKYLVKQQILFKRDPLIKSNFFNAGPKTVGLPDGAPDRIGQFLGYRIVKGFMMQNESLSLSELLKTKYNIILQSYEID